MTGLDIRLVFGRGMSGKSYLVRSWLRRRRGRWLVFDAAGEDEYANMADVVTADRRELLAALAGGDVRRIVWRGLDDGDWEFVNRAAWCAENITLVWEEVDSWWPPSARPEWAFKLVNQGRHRGVRIFACSRRPPRVSRDLSANASRIVAFGTREPNDVKYLREWIGPEAAGLADLAERGALDWDGDLAVEKKSPFL